MYMCKGYYKSNTNTYIYIHMENMIIYVRSNDAFNANEMQCGMSRNN